MSTKYYVERHHALPSTTKPDRIYYLALNPGELQVAFANATNTTIYKTPSFADIDNSVNTILDEPNGVRESISLLQDDSHTHTDLVLLNRLSTSINNYPILDNIWEISPIIQEEAW